MPSIFTKIVNNEIPSYKIYEDDTVLAFLDIHPETVGHTLVIPKKEVDKIYDLDDDTYMHLMLVAKSIASHMERQTGRRTLWKIIGTDVPHAHIHLMPEDETWQYGYTLDLAPEEFEDIRQKLAM
ncbi:HIT domain-containing protein [Candidatus Saccharibacteria bacterium]|nr:HIT domain-containing protein [Candidatus Saccharibacteria bacterium]